MGPLYKCTLCDFAYLTTLINQSFLTSQEPLQSNSPPFLKTKDSSPFSQKPPMLPVLNQTNQVITATSYFYKHNLILSSHQRLSFPSCLFLSYFLTKIFPHFCYLPSILHAIPISSFFVRSP